MELKNYQDLEAVLGVPMGELIYLAASIDEQVDVFYKKICYRTFEIKGQS